jgi:hypothetical protein
MRKRQTVRVEGGCLEKAIQGIVDQEVNLIVGQKVATVQQLAS